MRQLKTLILTALVLVFVAGVGTGAWVGTLAAAPRTRTVDRRVSDFQKFFDLSPTQVRQLSEILHDHNREKEKIRQMTELQQVWALEKESRSRIRMILTEEQRAEYDRRAPPR